MTVADVTLAAFDAAGDPILVSPADIQDTATAAALESAIAANASIATQALTSAVTSLKGSIASAHADALGAIAEVGAGNQNVVGRVDIMSITVDGNTAAITSEAAARSSADGALATQISQVSAAASTTAANVSSETTARTSADTALGYRIDQASATANGAASAVTTEIAARASANDALSGQLTSLSATVGSNNAAISNEAIARANGDSSLAGSISSMSATLGSVSASLTTTQGAIAGVQGRTSVFWQVVGQAGDGRVMLALYADANGGGAVQIVGNVLIDGSLVVTGSIQTGGIAPNAVTNVQASQAGSRTVPFSAGTSNPFDGISVTNNSPSGSLIRVDFTCNAFVSYAYTAPGSSAPPNGYYSLWRRQNGVDTQLRDWEMAQVFGGIPRLVLDQPAAGSAVTYLIKYATDAGSASSGSYPVTGEQIVIMETKR